MAFKQGKLSLTDFHFNQNLTPIIPLIFAFLLSLMASCSKSDDAEPLKPSVSVSVRLDGAPLSDGSTIALGSKVLLDVSFTAPAGIRSLSVNSQTYAEDDLGGSVNETQGSIQLYDSITAAPGSEITYTFVAQDQMLQSSDTLTFLLQVVSPSLDEYSVTLTIEDTDANSFYDAIEKAIYSLEEASDHSDKIDLVFYYFNENAGVIGGTVEPGYVLSSLNSQDARAFYSIELGVDFETFPIVNSTGFVELPNPVAFEELATDEDLQNAFGPGGLILESNRTELAAGDIFGISFDKDRGNKFGVIRVSELAGSEATKERSISFEMKVGNRTAQEGT